ncbi:MAG: hypothetical protein R3F21_22880 [Myxococcota bacterium]
MTLMVPEYAKTPPVAPLRPLTVRRDGPVRSPSPRKPLEEAVDRGLCAMLPEVENRN